MRVHFISIGGSIMHNLAIALKKKGYRVSGSDDEIYEPARSRLKNHGLLPVRTGWSENHISGDIDFVVLGMHAKEDNPELGRALELGLKIVSFPEFIYEQSRDKKRIVIAGSHGKTTITSMLMHVLGKAGFNYDYLVGSKIDGFEDSVKLSEDAEYMIIEGDEYLTSSLDHRPKFLWYKPHIALISGVAWDHMNVFPSFDIYQQQFIDFIVKMKEEDTLIYYEGDEYLPAMVEKKSGGNVVAYDYPEYGLRNNVFYLGPDDSQVETQIFGGHNMLNISGVAEICKQLGMSREEVYRYMADFKGAGKRLELFKETEDYKVFRDFAHAPSKVRATIAGIREQYPNKTLYAVLELHTYSSLNKAFLPEYRNSMDGADDKVVYINPHAVKLKGLDMLSESEIIQAFRDPGVRVIFDRDKLLKYLQGIDKKEAVILMMSSGNYDNLDFSEVF